MKYVTESLAQALYERRIDESFRLNSIVRYVDELLSNFSILSLQENKDILNKVDRLERYVEKYPFFATTIDKRGGAYEKSISYDETLDVIQSLIRDYERYMYRLGFKVDNVRRFNTNSRSKFTSAEVDIGDGNFLGIQIEAEPSGNGQMSMCYMSVGVLKKMKLVR